MRIVATIDQYGLPMCGEPFVGIGALYIYNGQKKKNHIRFMLNQTGCHRFSLLLSLRAILLGNCQSTACRDHCN